ncbi:unnamed protein product [Angiostrongylus costaricensis]|uniref:5'-3' exoribonuclease n=1 Tax=Angiostrongylus costaricensis TaxID=334426 RepID=A0A158PJZ6_ANGCS|nr:unnamed protein product [Angiostrongylus costaricensis]
MGVPKFYRWISERYPCLSEVIVDSEIPEFDNLYLDMNGIIHHCSHPDDSDVMLRIPQEQIFADIFAYVDTLFNIIRPKKVFFLAVDGVAPRAKMNQQRARRFMSARTAEEQIQALIRKGEAVPTEKRFDSNCITPGTVFMSELHKALSAWLSTKIEKDVAWGNIRVYLSGHDCPGEGEHKIMEFIRHERSLEGYDPNTKHCLYGLDADLLMLGICSHEPHFSLLREEVRFSRPQSKRTGVSSIKFHLLHLSLLREYLSWEFYPLKTTLPFAYDMERIVDDWILMGFLVGNDFIPHLPHVHIHEDALPLLYQTYIQVLPTLDGYINESGILHLKRFEIFLKAFAANDRRYFLQKCGDERYMRSKTGNYPKEKVRFLLSSINCWTKAVSNSFRRHKREYYREKLKFENISKSELREQAEGYVRAVQWNLHYYYRGCVSWNWYYSHHYAPYISDVIDFSNMDITFELGEPFKPFEQLLAVLPIASSECLPPSLRELMCDKESPIADFYPTDFRTDLNGKRNDWEAVVLIPFIDEKRLLSAMESKMLLLTSEEKCRNTFGDILVFTSSCTNSNKYLSVQKKKSTLLRCSTLPRDAFHLDPQSIKYGLLPNVKMDVYFPGFPTMKHLPHSAELKQVLILFQYRDNTISPSFLFLYLIRSHTGFRRTVNNSTVVRVLAGLKTLNSILVLYRGFLTIWISYRNKLIPISSWIFRDLFSYLEKANSTDDAYLASDIWENKEKREAELYEGKSCPDADADFILLDRVNTNVSKGTEIPFGLQGTVVGLYSTKVDVLFDQDTNFLYKYFLNRFSSPPVESISAFQERTQYNEPIPTIVLKYLQNSAPQVCALGTSSLLPFPRTNAFATTLCGSFVSPFSRPFFSNAWSDGGRVSTRKG